MASAAMAAGGAAGVGVVDGGGTHHLKAKFQIGSKRGRLNYSADEKVFHPSDVPAKAKEARLHVERSLRPDRRAGSGLPPPWDFGTVAGPAQSGTKTMPWDNDGWDDRHYAGIDTAALVAKAEQKMARIRAGKTADDDVRNINPRWNVSTFVEPPKEQLLISVKHPLPGQSSAAGAVGGAGGSPDQLNERDIKRLVKKAVPIPMGEHGSPTAGSAGAGGMVSSKISATGRARTADSKWLRDDRPSLKERVITDIEAQRAQKARARLATQHQEASAQLAALHNRQRRGPTTAGSAAAVRAEQLNKQISELTHKLGVSTAGGPAAVAAAVAAAAAAAPRPKSSAPASVGAAPASASASATRKSFGATGFSIASSSASASAATGANGAKPAKAVKKRMEHSGVYEAIGAAAASATRRESGWSCCLASDRNAPGCTAVGVSAAAGWNWTNM